MDTSEPAVLARGARHLGLELGPRELAKFKLYYELLVQWNRRVNLTSVVDYERVQIVHFLDSLTVLLGLPASAPPGRVVDIGTGAGFPGVPLKIVRPELALVLVESVGKKARFLHELVAALALEDVEIVVERAETLGQDPRYRERFDLALARAVAKLPALVEIALPLCRVGGLFIAQKKGQLRQETESAARAIALLGGQLREVRPVEAEGLADRRALIIIEKASATPARFPRKAGIPEKRPLV